MFTEVEATYCVLVMSVILILALILPTMVVINSVCNKQLRKLGNIALLLIVLIVGPIAFNYINPIPCDSGTPTAKAINEIIDDPPKPTVARIFPCPCGK